MLDNILQINDEWAHQTIKMCLPPRPKDSHKNQFGHVVVIGGDIGMVGAILMAGTAALRVGAGLVTLITNTIFTKDSIALATAQPELMIYGVDENPSSNLLDIINKATVIILGPGLGRSSWSRAIFKFVLNYICNENLTIKLRAIIIDADGLNLLSENNILNLANRLILTPHPGEAMRLLHNNTTDYTAEERLEIAKKISLVYNAIVILKGAGSLIYFSNVDSSNSNRGAICNYGNPGMSSPGMGDVLSGIIAGIIAQMPQNILENYTACCLAVYLHAKAADLQAQKHGERGLLATDLFYEIRKLINNCALD